MNDETWGDRHGSIWAHLGNLTYHFLGEPLMSGNLDLFVESTITAIKLDHADSRMEIEVKAPWGRQEQLRIVALGIDRLLMHEVRLYNIIERVNIFDANDFSDHRSEVAGRLFFLMRGRDPIDPEQEWPLLDEALSLLRSQKRVLMEIESVYGASILVLAKDIQVEPVADLEGKVARP